MLVGWVKYDQENSGKTERIKAIFQLNRIGFLLRVGGALWAKVI
jgi:hypothetical protein